MRPSNFLARAGFNPSNPGAGGGTRDRLRRITGTEENVRPRTANSFFLELPADQISEGFEGGVSIGTVGGDIDDRAVARC